MFKALLIILLLFTSCNQKEQTRNDKNIKGNLVVIDDESQKIEDVFINKFELNDETLLTESKKEYENLKTTLFPVKISENEFNNFIKKCNYKEDIISYYNLIYENKIKQFKKDNWNWTRSKDPINLNTNDSIMRISFMVNENSIKKEDSIMYSSDDFDKYKGYDISIMSLWIPLRTDIKIFTITPFVIGDLNHDGKKDCVITIHTEGGWKGGNTYWNDIFIFLTKDDGYELAYVITNSKISNAYRFEPELIKNNSIIGTAYYLDENDFYKDPSIKRFMKISFKNVN